MTLWSAGSDEYMRLPLCMYVCVCIHMYDVYVYAPMQDSACMSIVPQKRRNIFTNYLPMQDSACILKKYIEALQSCMHELTHILMTHARFCVCQLGLENE
jgi:hypothetical protein